MQNFKYPIFSIESAKVQNLDSYPQELILNGYFPNQIDLLLKNGKNIYFFLEAYVEMANEQWPKFKNNISYYKIPNLVLPKYDISSIDTIIYEGHINYFSGLDIAHKLIKNVCQNNNKIKGYYFLHNETRLNPPLRFSADYDQHLHSEMPDWQEYFYHIKKEIHQDQILSKNTIDKFLNSKVLLINPSICYHQVLFEESFKFHQYGVHGFYSDRNIFTSQYPNGHLGVFSASHLLNYNPFETNSKINSIIIEKMTEVLFVHLGK